ncbi:MAG: glycoside hydrolase family 97 N-terminal domain-containing protein [Chitinophagaceae bacterium]
MRNRFLEKSSLCLVGLALNFLFIEARCQDTAAILNSPDKKLQIAFTIGKHGEKNNTNQLVYTVSFNGKELIKPSTLSLDIKGYEPLGSNISIINAKTTSGDDSYQLVTGKASTIHNKYNELQLELEEAISPKRKLIIEARAYNDAVSFRYVVPQQTTSDSGYALKNENTEFAFAADAITYSQVLPHYRSMYESEYLKLPVSAFSNQGGVKSSVLIGLPMLAEVPGVGWLAIAETDLLNYTSMYLTNPSGGWTGHTMLSRLSPRLDSSGLALKRTILFVQHGVSLWLQISLADYWSRMQS